jgi:hypothetical protein
VGTFYSATAALGENRVVWPAWDRIRMSPTQWDLFHCPKKKRLFNAGRGLGKDWAALFRILYRSKELYWRRKAEGFERDGPIVHVAVAALSTPNVEPTWQKMRAMAPVVPGRSKDGIPNTAWNRREGTLKMYGENEYQVSLVSLWDTKLVLGDGYDFWLVTEGKLIDSQTLMETVLPMCERSDYHGDITLVSTPDNTTEWDEWCEQARDGRGYFSDWAYYHAEYWQNPRMSDERRREIAKLAQLNPFMYEREYLARLRVNVPESGNVECPVTPALLDCATTTERIVVQGAPLVAFDLAYGGQDLVVRTVWDKVTCGLAQIDCWTKDELGLTAENKFQGLSALFERTSRDFPGCQIVYDATGPNGSIVHLHVPRWVRIKGVTRNRAVKNKNVGDLIERLTNVGADGKSRGIRLPAFEGYPHVNETQRRNVKMLREDLLHYRQTVTEVRGQKAVSYTKGQGYGDDTVDSVTIACSELPAMRAAARVDVRGAMRARFQ